MLPVEKRAQRYTFLGNEDRVRENIVGCDERYNRM